MAVVLARLVDGDDAGMVDARHQLRFTQQPLAILLVERADGGHDLERHRLAGLGVRGAVDHAHPARNRLDAVPAKIGPILSIRTSRRRARLASKLDLSPGPARWVFLGSRSPSVATAGSIAGSEVAWKSNCPGGSNPAWIIRPGRPRTCYDRISVRRRDAVLRTRLGRAGEEALELAGDDVAGGEVLGRAPPPRRPPLEALDEGLHVRVALDREVDLALVVGGGCSSSAASTETPTSASSLRTSASAAFGFGAAAT